VRRDARDSRSRALYLERDVISAESCLRIRAVMTESRADDAEVLDAAVVADLDVRRAASIDVDASTLREVEARLDARADALSAFFGIALGPREGAGFLRYGPGGFYKPHRDRGKSDAWPAAAERCVSVVLFLNSVGPGRGDLDGGALHLIDTGVEIAPLAGQLVAFPSETLHEVMPVARGSRDVVVDWFYRGASGRSVIQSTTTPADGEAVRGTGRIARSRSLR